MLSGEANPVTAMSVVRQASQYLSTRRTPWGLDPCQTTFWGLERNFRVLPFKWHFKNNIKFFISYFILQLLCYVVCMCVHAYMCLHGGCGRMSVGIYMWSESNTGYLPQSFATLFLRQGLSLNQEFANLARFDGHQIPRIHQFLPLRAGVYRCVPLPWQLDVWWGSEFRLLCPCSEHFTLRAITPVLKWLFFCGIP